MTREREGFGGARSVPVLRPHRRSEPKMGTISNATDLGHCNYGQFVSMHMTVVYVCFGFFGGGRVCT